MDLFVTRAGDGPPVLLLHGFPQTHRCWDRVELPGFAVVAPDLPGYGEGYDKRSMAAALVALMADLGHERFAVVGHDRGARVAYRMAFDHPDRVSRAALLNVLPTVEQFERMATPSLGYWPWLLLAQPAPFPERLVGADPDALLDHVWATWPADAGAIPADARAAYRAAMTPGRIAAMCADYRASFHLDREHDEADRAAGRRIGVPLLVVTGAEETQLADAPEVWARWASDLRTATVPGGHFVPEEAPGGLSDLLRDFLGPAGASARPGDRRG